jgi:hypothetical protein
MSFGMCNAPITFQWMVNDILRDFLHKFVTVYLDDVYIYNRTLDEHWEHLRLVLQRFKEEGLKLRLTTCFFGLQEMEYLGYTVFAGRMLVSTKKSRPLLTSHFLKHRKRLAVLCNSARFYPSF